jgi:hypothetical protein
MTAYTPPLAPKVPGKTKIKVLLGVAFVAVALASCGVGAAMGSGPTKTVTVAGTPGPAQTVTVFATATVEAPAPVKAAVPTKAAPAPKPSFDDQGGDVTVIVGEDVPSGVWTVHGAPSDCYWKITKDGHPEDIVNNNIGGGTQRVTLKKGQDFESSGCGIWKKS